MLGFELHLKAGDKKLQVLYHFFLTDDTAQDLEAVLCAKHFLYTVVLPTYGKKKVHFRSDGAGFFSSKEAKSGMVFFGGLSKVKDTPYESSYKFSVAGCGKTSLDVSNSLCDTHFLHLATYTCSLNNCTHLTMRKNNNNFFQTEFDHHSNQHMDQTFEYLGNVWSIDYAPELSCQ